MNMVHHLMSNLASELIRLISQCFRCASVSNEMSLLINDLPGFTTLHAWLRCRFKHLSRAYFLELPLSKPVELLSWQSELLS